MMLTRAVKDWFSLLRQHSKIAAPACVLGAAAVLTAGTLWPKHYIASALIAPNLQTAPPSARGGPAQQGSMSVILRQTSDRQDWAGTVTRFQLYPGIVAQSGLSHAGAYLASQVSLQPVAAPDLGGGEAIQLSYAGEDRNLVASVMDAIADGFTRPLPGVENSQVTPSLQTSTQASATASEEPLYAPVVLPVPLPNSNPAEKPSRRNSRTTRKQARKPGRKASSSSRVAARSKVHTASAPSSALLNQLRSSLVDGAKLREALEQNAAALDDLRTQQQKAETAPPPAPAPKDPAATQHQPDPQLEHLRQQLAGAQRTLDALRLRYTDEYPDVVIAREKVQDIQLDISRLAVTTRATRPQAASKSATQPQPEAGRTAPVGPSIDLAAIAAQLRQAEAAETNLRDAIDRNRSETARLEAAIAAQGNANAAGTSPNLQAALALAAENPADGSETGSAKAAPMPLASAASAQKQDPSTSTPSSAPFFLVQQTTVATTPFFLARKLLWPLSLVFGILAALLAAWVAERRDPSIRGEGMLRHELPPSAVYLGGIPRIRHEVVAD